MSLMHVVWKVKFAERRHHGEFDPRGFHLIFLILVVSPAVIQSVKYLDCFDHNYTDLSWESRRGIYVRKT